VLIAAFATVRFFRFVRVFSYFRVLVSGQAKKCLQEAEQMTTQKNDQKK
jgi:hypothetical protein